MSKIFVTDIDGTVLPLGESEFSQETKVAFKRIIKEERLILATGRTYRACLNLFSFLSYKELNKIIFIVENGNIVYWNNEIVYLNKFPQKLALDIVTSLMEYKECATLVSLIDKALYYEEIGDLYYDDEELPSLILLRKDQFIDMIKKDEIVKISLHLQSKELDKDKIKKEIVDEYSHQNVSIFDANNSFLDLSYGDGDKGSSLSLILDKYDLSNNDLYIFGDGENDLSMLKLTKNSYSPLTSLEEVKEKVNHIYTSFKEEVDKILNN